MECCKSEASRVWSDLKQPIHRDPEMTDWIPIVHNKFVSKHEDQRLLYEDLMQRFKNSKLQLQILKRVDFAFFDEKIEQYVEVKECWREVRREMYRQRKLKIDQKRAAKKPKVSKFMENITKMGMHRESSRNLSQSKLNDSARQLSQLSHLGSTKRLTPIGMQKMSVNQFEINKIIMLLDKKPFMTARVLVQQYNKLRAKRFVELIESLKTKMQFI